MTSAKAFDDPSTELSARRTGMSFQRTRMSADRTLMSVIRTSLSLISFGFTIHKVFEQLKENGAIAHGAAGRNFGAALVVLGIVMLVIGIGYHGSFMLGLRRQRGFPPSMTLISAILLLLLGLVLIANILFRVGPFE
jgi:putative membrane protein